jgi:hypothetical protein
MATAIPSSQNISLQAELPAGTDEWPGPPSWAPSLPDQATVSLVPGSNQMQATVSTVADVTVTVTCQGLAGSVDFTVDDQQPVPAPVTVALA